MKPIHIFKTGTHTDSGGQTLTFSETDLTNAVNAYNPSIHQAPIVVGHPKTDAPAFGWVQSLSASDGNLFATPEQVNTEFSEQVKAGSYKKVSASFYSPNSPANPVKGVYYLRHVGFLGAEPPAIKGLQPIEFSEQDNADDAVTLTLDFSETQTSKDASNKKSAFDSVVSALYSLFFGEQAAATTEADTSVNPPIAPNSQPQSKTEPEQKDETMSNTPPNTNQTTPPPVNDDAVAKKDAEIARLQAELDAKTAAEAKAKADALAKENSDFAEGLVAENKIAPKDKALVTAILDGLDTAESVQPIDFGEGDDKQPLKQAVKEKLADAEAGFSYLFSESATKANTSTGKHEFNAPKGAVVDGDALAMHQEALAYAEAHGVDYATAVMAMEG